MRRKGIRLGVDLGGTAVKLALVDGNGRVVDRRSVRTSGGPSSLAAALRTAVGPWLKGRRLLGTGVGVAGDVNPDRGVVRFAPNLGWRNVPLKSLLVAAGFPRPLFIDNDATAAAWGAWRTEVRERARNLIVLTLGTGVGGGLVIDGKLYHGSTGTAGELGHVCVDPGGPRCGCGARGCLEVFVGGRHLVSWARGEYARRGRRAPGELTPELLNERARSGDAVARAAWERAGRALGVAVAGFLNVFNPDAVVLAGGLAGAAPRFMPALRRELSARAFLTPRRAARILVSRRVNDLGVVGAALLIP